MTERLEDLKTAIRKAKTMGDFKLLAGREYVDGSPADKLKPFESAIAAAALDKGVVKDIKTLLTLSKAFNTISGSDRLAAPTSKKSALRTWRNTASSMISSPQTIKKA